MQNGGDIETAYRAGDMGAMVYTHYYHSGHNPSYFMTLDGVKETLRSLPNQIEDVGRKFRDLFDSFRDDAPSSFNLDTGDEGQTINCFTDEEVQEPAEGIALVPRSMLYDVRLQSYMKQTEAQLALERERVVMEKERTAMERERTATAMEKTKAAKEMADFQLKAEKDNSNLKLQIKDAEHRAEKAQWEKERLMARIRENRRQGSTATDDKHCTDSDDEEGEPVAKRTDNKPRKLKTKLSHFSQISVVAWDNELPGVNFFVELADDEPVVEEYDELPPPVCPARRLIVRMVNGPASEDPDNKQFIMALFYKGKRTSKQALINSFMVKEAYGVEAGGLQYLCLILYRNNGRRMRDIARILYDNGILPHSVTPEPIPNTDGSHHISVFRVSAVTNDPVVTMLKKPSLYKWKWFNTK